MTETERTNDWVQRSQEQADEVVGLMRENVQKVLERDQKLSELDERAEVLQRDAAQFKQQVGKLKHKYWWQNVKMMIIMGVLGVILVIGLIGLIIWWVCPSSSHDSSLTPALTNVSSTTEYFTSESTSHHLNFTVA